MKTWIIKTGFIKTADFLILGQEWELKTPTGRHKRTIEHQLERASKQSRQIVIDLRYTKITDRQAISRIRAKMKSGDLPKLKWVIIILHSGEVEKIV